MHSKWDQRVRVLCLMFPLFEVSFPTDRECKTKVYMVWPLWELLLHNVLIRLSGEKKKKVDRIGYLFIFLLLLLKSSCSTVNAKASGWFLAGFWRRWGKVGEEKKEARTSEWMSSRVCAVSICRGLTADMLTWRPTPWWWTATPRGKYHPPTMSDRWCEQCCCHAEWIVPTTQGLWLEAVKATWGARQWHHSKPESGPAGPCVFTGYLERQPGGSAAVSPRILKTSRKTFSDAPTTTTSFKLSNYCGVFVCISIEISWLNAKLIP